MEVANFPTARAEACAALVGGCTALQAGQVGGYDPVMLALLDVTTGRTLTRRQRVAVARHLEDAIVTAMTGADALRAFTDAVQADTDVLHGVAVLPVLRRAGFHV